MCMSSLLKPYSRKFLIQTTSFTAMCKENTISQINPYIPLRCITLFVTAHRPQQNNIKQLEKHSPSPGKESFKSQAKSACNLANKETEKYINK